MAAGRFSPVPAALRALGADVAVWLQNAANRRAAAVADLDQTIGATPTQAEVQAISDKLDALMAALRAAGLLEE
jgi:hypothetical protein